MGIAMEKVLTSGSKLGSCNHEEDATRLSCMQSILLNKMDIQNPDKTVDSDVSLLQFRGLLPLD